MWSSVCVTLCVCNCVCVTVCACLQFKCCGSNRSDNWADSLWIRSARAEGRAVPDSCCKSPTAGCGARDHPSNISRGGVRGGGGLQRHV